jgi:anti-anti-sigma regulatory factor
MMPVPTSSRRVASGGSPTYQWEPVRVPNVLTLRLYGCLGVRELRRVAETLLDRGRSPRDLVTVDFDQVDHLDYRAIPEFAVALSRQRDRGAMIWLIGLSAYLRRLFDVAGQGPTLRRLEWISEGTHAQERGVPFGLDPSVTPTVDGAHRGAWQ